MLADAEEWQVRKGKRMMFRLTKRLQAYVQRKDESVLAALLPPKEELVIFVRCSEPQQTMYRDLIRHHLDICDAARGEGGEACKCRHLLAFHAAAQKIVNHPDTHYDKWWLEFCRFGPRSLLSTMLQFSSLIRTLHIALACMRLPGINCPPIETCELMQFVCACQPSSLLS